MSHEQLIICHHCYIVICALSLLITLLPSEDEEEGRGRNGSQGLDTLLHEAAISIGRCRKLNIGQLDILQS